MQLTDMDTVLAVAREGVKEAEKNVFPGLMEYLRQERLNLWSPKLRQLMLFL